MMIAAAANLTMTATTTTRYGEGTRDGEVILTTVMTMTRKIMNRNGWPGKRTHG
jgi:hypothetical protein